MAKAIAASYVLRMTAFLPRLDILPQSQRVVWDELTEIPVDFTLYGDTAIALHLGHRQSVDFDFFGWRTLAPLDLASELALLKAGTALQSEPNTLPMLVDRGGPVKLSFFGVPRLKRVALPHISADTVCTLRHFSIWRVQKLR